MEPNEVQVGQDRHHFHDMARTSLEELKYQILLSYDLKEPLQNLSPCHSDDSFGLAQDRLREEESGTIKRTRFFTSFRMTLLQRSL